MANSRCRIPAGARNPKAVQGWVFLGATHRNWAHACREPDRLERSVETFGRAAEIERAIELEPGLAGPARPFLEGARRMLEGDR